MLTFVALAEQVKVVLSSSPSADEANAILYETAVMAAQKYRDYAARRVPGFEARFEHARPMRTRTRDGKAERVAELDHLKVKQYWWHVWEVIAGRLTTDRPTDIPQPDAEMVPVVSPQSGRKQLPPNGIPASHVHYYESDPGRWRARALRYRAALSRLADMAGETQHSERPADGGAAGATIEGKYPSELAQLLGCSDDTLRKYAKAVTASRSGRGKRNFRYCGSDIMKIFRHASVHSGDTSIRAKACSLLEADRNPN
jgi:hypothetical protein